MSLLSALSARVAGRVAHETVGRFVRHQEERPDQRAVYGALGELSRRHAHCRASLSSSELKVFSQNGEDGVLAEIFDRIGEGQRFFVEFGVESGVECNTRYLAEVLGWSGVYFEPDSDGHASLARRYANNAAVKALREFVTPETINDCFAKAGVPKELDLLSIDIDGQDYWVWRALESYRPRVVVVEYNSALPASSALVEPRGRVSGFTGTDYFGASREAFVRLADEKGYALVHAELSGTNLFFVRIDLSEPFVSAVTGRTPNYLLAGLQHSPGVGEYVNVDAQPSH